MHFAHHVKVNDDMKFHYYIFLNHYYEKLQSLKQLGFATQRPL